MKDRCKEMEYRDEEMGPPVKEIESPSDALTFSADAMTYWIEEM